MNLHDQIMNLPCPGAESELVGSRLAYWRGHRDARHAAAELALAADEGYGRVCKLVVDMHEAATGRPGEGPRVGVIEDVAIARAELVELAALRKDAERYRWLRNGSDEWECFDSRWLTKHDVYGQGPAELDAAIDAAMFPGVDIDAAHREKT